MLVLGAVGQCLHDTYSRTGPVRHCWLVKSSACCHHHGGRMAWGRLFVLQRHSANTLQDCGSNKQAGASCGVVVLCRVADSGGDNGNLPAITTEFGG